MISSRLKRKARTHNVKPSSECHFDRQHSAMKRARQCCEHVMFNSQGDEEDHITMPRPSNSLRHSPYSLRESRAPIVNYRVLSTYHRPTIIKIDTQLKGNHQTTVKKVQQKPCSTSSEKKFDYIGTVECQSNLPFDPVSRDEIVRKISTCLSFYGNFVIIPEIRKTLDNIENMDHDTKFNYWHEVMAFIDSYDFPYAGEQRKKLVDELVEKITAYVASEGISIQDWQKIISTLPDDVSNKFDYRLEDTIMKEIEALAKQDQLPFDLSKPVVNLLQSAKKHAGQYIRDSSS